jgi:hypothetical protein
MQWIERKSFAIYFYSFFIVFMVIRYFDELFLHQLISNPIRSPRVDLVVWITHFIGIPNLISNQFVSLSFDFVLILLPIIILYRVFKNKKINKLSALLCGLFGLYILLIYCFPTLSIRKYFGLVLIPIAFIFQSKKRYYYYLELMRYYILFVFTSASLWKILRGVAWDPRHMHLTLKAQHIDNFVNWPDHYITKLIASIIAHPSYCTTLFLLAVVSQLLFFTGFITKKYDKLLAILMLIFILSDYLVMRIEYWEFIVFLPLLLGKYPDLNKINETST